jgi:DNA-binding transcriptional ArsR family regulator
MTTSRDLLLHPVRLRIIQALAGRPMRPLELKEHLGDVAQATLYRHLNQLESGGLIRVLEERPVRGGVERTYGVVDSAISLGPADLFGATADDHLGFFATFIGALLSDFAAYVERSDLDFVADRVGYRQIPLWLSDREFDELAAAMSDAIQAHLANEPRRDRRRRLLTTIVMPDDRTPPEEHGRDA